MIRIPAVVRDWSTFTSCQSRDGGYACTRAAGHTGRHSAGCGREDDGTQLVVRVWADEEQETKS